VSSASDPLTGACFVCTKHARGGEAPGGVLYQDELVYAGHVHGVGGETAYRGHLVLEPLRHVEGFGLLTDDEAARLGRLANQLAALLRATLGADHVYVWSLGGAPETQRTPRHLHVHLVPRYPDTPREYWGPMLTRWPNAQRVDEQAMRALLTELRKDLATN
jgi:histidine triad (HIT) family protein